MNETLRMETTKRTLNVKPFPMDSVLKMIRAHYEKNDEKFDIHAREIEDFLCEIGFLEPPKYFTPEHLKRMGVTIEKGDK